MNCNPSYMLRAIELAKKGEGFVNPNPLVGAVIVKDDEIIGEGFHHVYGGLHAEREALKDCLEKGNNPKDATIYVTLEPCCHKGKQPPCTQALLEAGLARVVVGSRDPNPLVHGKGCEFLRQNGVEVIEDFLREECDAINQIFFHFITTSTPYVALKYAMTMDGKIATRAGKSKWITSDESRRYVHELRNRYSAILAGIGTVLSDDPMLNCRLEKQVKNPLRIILDSSLRIPLESRIMQSAHEIPTIIACSENISCSEKTSDDVQIKIESIEKLGAEVLFIKEDDEGKPDLRHLMKVLGERKIDSVLIEGGSKVNFSALKSDIVNHVYAFVGPMVFGGSSDGIKTPVSGIGVQEVSEAFTFTLEKTSVFGSDILLEYSV